MSNDQMVAGRFLKLQKGRNKMRWIEQALASGRKVYIRTHLKTTKCSRFDQFKMDSKGNVYSQHGNRWDCINFNKLVAQ